MTAPWWYRARGYVIMAIFVIGFWGGAWLWYLTGRPFVEVFSSTGHSLKLLIVATLCTLVCYLLRLWGSSYLTAATVWNPNAETDSLFVDGPFRFLRNPLYLGNLFLAIGLGMLATPIGFLIIVVGHAFFLTMLANYEKIGMHAKYGATYDAYCAAVPAFFPRLTPATINGSTRGKPTLSKGFRAELFSGIVVLAMIVHLIWGSRGAPAFYTMIVMGWILQGVMAR